MRALQGLAAAAALLLAHGALADQYKVTLPCEPIPGSLRIAPAAPRLFVLCQEGADTTGHIVDLPGGKPLLSMRSSELPGPAISVDFAADGEKLAVMSNAGMATLYTVGGEPRRWAAGTPGSGLTFVGGSRVLASGIEAWDVRAEPKALGTLRTEFGGIAGTALSPDGRVVAVAGEDTTIRLYDAATLRPLREITRMTTPVSISFSADGRQLFAGGGMLRRVTAYDVASGAEVKSWKTGLMPFLVMALPDGKSIAMLALTVAAAPGTDAGPPPQWQAIDIASGTIRPLAPGRRVDALSVHGGRTWCFTIDGNRVAAWTP